MFARHATGGSSRKSAYDIGFVDFLINIVPVSAACIILPIILLFIWFRHDVRATDDKRREVLEGSPSDAIRDKSLLWKSVGVFALTAAGFLVHDLLDVSPAFIAIAGASVLLLVSRLEPGEVLRGLEWSTLTFFAGLFVMVGALVETGITDQLQRWMVNLPVAARETWRLYSYGLAGVCPASWTTYPTPRRLPLLSSS